MLSKRLRIARTARGYTQEKLAKLVNTTKGTISNYENGHSTPSNEMLAKLADVLNTTTDFLLGRTDNMELTIEEKLDRALQLRDGEKIYFYDMEGLTDEDIEMLKKQIELYREMSERKKREKQKNNSTRG